MAKHRRATSLLNLWKPIVPEDRQHPNFRTIRQIGTRSALAEVRRWSEGFADRDGKFVTEFQTTFDSSFWELYLHRAFWMLGYRADYSYSSPDFALHKGKSTMIAEAVIASHAQGYRPEWDKLDIKTIHEDFDLHQAVRYTTTRIANAFVTKADKYISHYSTLTHVKGQPFVICIAPYDSPFTFDWALHALRRVLYQFDQPIVHRGEGRDDPIIIGHSGVETVTKDNGRDIELGFFRDSRFNHVSAVIFSSVATFSKARLLSDDPMKTTFIRAERYNAMGTTPLITVAQKPQYKESLLDGLLVCLNPYATRPLDIRPFVGRGIGFESWDYDAHQYICDVPHEWLIRRFMWTVRVSENMKPQTANKSKEYKVVGRPKWPDGELRPIPAALPPFVDNHMAHCGEWTAIVCRDLVDNTWQAMAIHSIVYTIPEFRDHNHNDDVDMIMTGMDHDTKDEAFIAIKAQIAHSSTKRVPTKES